MNGFPQPSADEPIRFGEAEVLPLSCELEELTLILDSAEASEPTTAQRTEWDRRTDSNRRLFNGSILAFAGFDADTRVVHARRDTYQRLITQHTDADAERVVHLSVTGVLLAKDADERVHVLLGKRSNEPAVYPGMWEFAPSGGIDPPSRALADLDTPLDGTDVWRQLDVEMQEELDLPGSPDPGRIEGIVLDHAIPSADILVVVRFARLLEDMMAAADERGNWEYATTRWIALDDIAEFDRRENELIIPPARAVFRYFDLA
ncbi:MAG: hypothetical protein AAF747_00195 [Planctomycetota bacterium]